MERDERAGLAVVRPDPERLSAGWQHRFVAAGARAAEMIALYEELGFEVAFDPIPMEDFEPAADGCSHCFGSASEPYRSIYTRRRQEADSVSEAHPTRVLRDEHRRILQVADALEVAVDVAPESLDYDHVDKCIRFIRLFADACHHGKEEDLLFPALVEGGLPEHTGPIAVMLHEHRIGRRLAATMAAAIRPAREGIEEARVSLVDAARDYIALIRSHIGKEDHALFEMADQMLVGPRCTGLCAAYSETAGRTFEGCTKAELEALAEEIVG